MKKIFVSTTYYGERSSVIKAINGLKKLDISGIELGSNHRLEKSYNFLNEIKFELFSHNYFPPEDKDFVLNVSSNSQTTRNRSIDFIKKSIEFCFEHNVQMYTFHPGFNSEVISPDINGRKFDFKFFKSKDFDTRRNFENLINSVDKILNFSNGSNLKLAIETGGSLTNPLVPLIQTPYELRSFFDTFSNKNLGINLNLAHSYLASKFWNFKLEKLIEDSFSNIFAVELSRISRDIDSHLHINGKEPYFNIALNLYKKSIPIILEYRKTSILNIKNSLKFFRIENEF